MRNQNTFNWDVEKVKEHRFLLKNTSKDMSDMELAANMYMVGFHQSKSDSYSVTSSLSERDYCLISLADGMVYQNFNLNGFVDMLNKESKGYVPATHKEVFKAINFRFRTKKS